MDYIERYKKYAFNEGGIKFDYKQQHEGILIKICHSVEKGLANSKDFRPGFGEKNIRYLVALMNSWADEYSTDDFAYKTALSCLHEYVARSKENGYINSDIEQMINKVKGIPNEYGGSEEFIAKGKDAIQRLNYAEMIRYRRSIRQFSPNPVNEEDIVRALALAQYAPSACNRQGWKVRVANGELKDKVLENQNGNKGFGLGIDKLIIITMDLRYSNSQRETYQAYIDGGIYAQNLLNSLTYYNIATVPLSASLTERQEANIREIAGINDAEVLILFIGMGNYPDETIRIPKSVRKPVALETIGRVK